MGFFIGGTGGNGHGGSSVQVDNFAKSYVISDWVLVDGMYELTVEHNQNTNKILIDVYENGTDANINGIKQLNNNSIKLMNDVAVNCLVVINSGSRTPTITNDVDNASEVIVASAKSVKTLNDKIENLQNVVYDVLN